MEVASITMLMVKSKQTKTIILEIYMAFASITMKLMAKKP